MLAFIILSVMLFVLIAGLVPKPKSQVEKDREVLGKEYDNGRVWSVRCNGEALVATAR